MLAFKFFEPFGLTDASGADVRPKLMKSRAILAMLAATPGSRLTRSWLLGVLWPDRQQAQAQSSLRTSLTDIRKHLGPYSDALVTDHIEVSLKPESFTTDLEERPKNSPLREFLEGFDVPNSPEFDHWLLNQRMHFNAESETAQVCSEATQTRPSPDIKPLRLYLTANRPTGSRFIQAQCDTLVDDLAKYLEDLGFAQIIDGRGGLVRSTEISEAAFFDNCELALVSEVAELPGSAIARIKVLDTSTGALIYSKTLLGNAALDLDDPANFNVGAELADILLDRMARSIDLQQMDLTPQLSLVSGIRHVFKLGTENFKIADRLFEHAYQRDRRGLYLAWRSYLRTFLIGEMEFSDRQSVIEEGTAFSRQARESEPNNSMVLALCAHVENMLHDNYQNAFDLSSRALEINRCNPLAWACLGQAAAFLGKEKNGSAIASLGATWSRGSVFDYQTQLWASSTALLAGNLKSAQRHAELSHTRAPDFAPPMRFLSALYCADSQFERASAIANKLREREPEFTLDRLGDEGYPSDCIRKADLLRTLPTREI